MFHRGGEVRAEPTLKNAWGLTRWSSRLEGGGGSCLLNEIFKGLGEEVRKRPENIWNVVCM